MKPSGPGLLFAGRFLITVSISVLVMGLLRFSISSGQVLESCTFLRICPFLLRCPSELVLIWFHRESLNLHINTEHLVYFCLNMIWQSLLQKSIV